MRRKVTRRREGRGGKKKGRERREDGRRGKEEREEKGLERGSFLAVIPSGLCTRLLLCTSH